MQKEKELKAYGTRRSRTRRLVLEAYDSLTK